VAFEDVPWIVIIVNHWLRATKHHIDKGFRCKLSLNIFNLSIQLLQALCGPISSLKCMYYIIYIYYLFKQSLGYLCYDVSDNNVTILF